MADSTSAADARGRRTLELGGREWTLTPTFEALDAIEAALGVKLMPLFLDFTRDHDYGPRQVATVFRECMREAHGIDRPSLEAVGQWVVGAGVQPMARIAAELIGTVIVSPEDAAKAGQADPGN